MFLHNKETTHNSTTLTNTYSKSSGRQFQVSKFEIYKKKKKNVSIRSYIIRKQHITPPPSQIPIQESWAPIPSLQVQNLQKKKKNVSIRSYIIRKQHTTPPPSQIPIPRVLGANFKSPSSKSTKKRKRMLVYVLT